MCGSKKLPRDTVSTRRVYEWSVPKVRHNALGNEVNQGEQGDFLFTNDGGQNGDSVGTDAAGLGLIYHKIRSIAFEIYLMACKCPSRFVAFPRIACCCSLCPPACHLAHESDEGRRNRGRTMLPSSYSVLRPFFYPS